MVIRVLLADDEAMIRAGVKAILAAAAEIRRATPETAVVMLATFGEDEYIARAATAPAASCSSPATRAS